MVLRIGASLDLDTVLSEVVEGARALTGAGCGASDRLNPMHGSGLTGKRESRAVLDLRDPRRFRLSRRTER